MRSPRDPGDSQMMMITDPGSDSSHVMHARECGAYNTHCSAQFWSDLRLSCSRHSGNKATFCASRTRPIQPQLGQIELTTKSAGILFLTVRTLTSSNVFTRRR